MNRQEENDKSQRSERQYTEIVKAIHNLKDMETSLAIQNQRQNSLALMVGLANQHKLTNITKEQEYIRNKIALGEKVVGNLVNTVENQGQQINETNRSVQEHSASIDQLRAKVSEQRSALEKMAQDYEKEMKEQRAMIEKHKNDFKLLIMSKLKQDASLDSAILLIAWLALRVPVLNWPVSILSSILNVIPVIPGEKKSRSMVSTKVAKIFVWLVFVRALRISATRQGFHNAIGGPEAYLSQIFKYVSETPVNGALSGTSSTQPVNNQKQSPTATNTFKLEEASNA